MFAAALNGALNGANTALGGWSWGDSQTSTTTRTDRCARSTMAEGLPQSSSDNTSSSHGNAAKPAGNVVDLVRDVVDARTSAQNGDWMGAAEKSVDVARDVIDVARDVGDAFVESRGEAVSGGYAANSDVGFQ